MAIRKGPGMETERADAAVIGLGVGGEEAAGRLAEAGCAGSGAGRAADRGQGHGLTGPQGDREPIRRRRRPQVNAAIASYDAILVDGRLAIRWHDETIESAVRRHELTRSKAIQAVRDLHRQGRPVTVATVASTAGISRSWLYTQPDLRD
jgi:hypothetical protein